MQDGTEKQFDQPSASDVHQDGVVSVSRSKRALSGPYLNKMFVQLKQMCGNGPVTREHFAEAVRVARGHAGGTAKAARRADASVQAGEYDDDILSPLEVGVLPGDAPAMPCDCPNCSGASCVGCGTPDSGGCDSSGCGCDCSTSAESEPDRDADDLPGLEKADERVNYRKATKVGTQCGMCRFYCGDGDYDSEEDHECVIVEGWIDPQYVCNLFAPRVDGGTSTVGTEELKAFGGPGSGPRPHGGADVNGYGGGWHETESNFQDMGKKIASSFKTEGDGDNKAVSLNGQPVGTVSKSGDGDWLAHHTDSSVAMGGHSDEEHALHALGALHMKAMLKGNDWYTGKLGPKKASEDVTDLCEAASLCPIAYSEDRIEHSGGWAIFTELPKEFIEPPNWINYLPKPGSYKSERYGMVIVSPDRNVRFIKNFRDAVYQQKLPIDLEHETKLSGAAGWITDMRMNEDRSVDARVEWTDRGADALRKNRFHYFSPEFYDKWTDPMRPQLGAFRDVAIGGGLTTRPFFKERALRSLVMSERGLEIREFSDEDRVKLMTEAEEDTMAGTDGTETVSTGAETESVKASELRAMSEQIAAKDAELAALRLFNEQQSDLTMQMSERIGALESDRRRKRFTDMVRGVGEGDDGRRWFGEIESNVAMLETLADTLEGGETNPLFEAHIERMRGLAEQAHTAGLFSEHGTDAHTDVNDDGSAFGKLQQYAEAVVAEGRAKNLGEAHLVVAREHPETYAEYVQERRRAL